MKKDTGYQSKINDNQFYQFEGMTTIQRKNGSISHVEIRVIAPFPYDGGVSHQLIALTDITERIKTITQKEEIMTKLKQAEKFRSVSLLAGGVAHDFNNYLMAIVGNVAVLKLMIETEDALERLEKIEEISESASKLTQQILTYAGKASHDFKVYDLNQLILNMDQLINIVVENVKLEYNLYKGQLDVLVDQSLMQRYILNLVKNAEHSIDNSKGVIKITTGKTSTLPANPFFNYHDPSNKNYCFISISDTGSGIPNHQKKMIFDPFYTTSKTGTGLGLSVVQGIVKTHNAILDLKTEVGSGTEFILYIPMDIRQKQVKMTEEIASSIIGAKIDTILIADDNEEILSTLSTIIQDMGIEVITSTNGEEALERFYDNGNNIDMFILDVNMPKLDGLETMYAIRKNVPNVPILLMSGYTNLMTNILEKESNQVHFINKPFTKIDLEKTINHIISS